VCVPDTASWLADFMEEVTSFPAAPHDDQVDAFTKALSYLRGSGFDFQGLRSIGALQTAYDARRCREASYASGMISNVADADVLEYGASATGGVRYTGASREVKWTRAQKVRTEPFVTRTTARLK
jgi:hypothetical protein